MQPENENQEVEDMLLACEDFQKLQQEISTGMRKGFLQLTKAKMAAGHGQISALNCRSELSSFVSIDVNKHGGSASHHENKQSMKQSIYGSNQNLWSVRFVPPPQYGRKDGYETGGRISTSTEDHSTNVSSGLRRRGNKDGSNQEKEPRALPLVSNQAGGGGGAVADPLELFAGALAPRPLRRAQGDFRAVLESAVAAANRARPLLRSLGRLGDRAEAGGRQRAGEEGTDEGKGGGGAGEGGDEGEGDGGLSAELIELGLR